MRSFGVAFFILFCTPLAALGAGHDYPGLGHIQGYHLYSYSERGYDKATLEADQGQKISVDGHTTRISYFPDDQSNHSSSLEIYLNYLSALKALKAEILRSPENMEDSGDHALARFYRNGTPIYVNIKVDSGGTGYYLFIVEQKEFQPSIVSSPDQ